MRSITEVVVLALLIVMPVQAQVINEIMSSNGNTLADAEGDYEDWIELYNPGDIPIDLTGYYLSDNIENPLKWQFPDRTMQPNDYLLVWASGKDKLDGANALHTNFSISADGEPLILTAPDGVTFIDFVPAIYIPRDVSYGRQGDGTGNWVFFAEPTPGTTNNTQGYYGVLDPPGFSHEAGFYEDGFYLELSHPDPDVTIYYTLEGSTATVDSHIYVEPIWVDSRKGEANNISLIPTAPAYEWRAPLSEVFKSTVVNTVSVRNGYIASHPMVKSFFIDEDFQNKYSVPVISISTDNEHLFSEDTGILVPGNKFNNGSQWGHQANYTQTGDEWERPATMEFFEEDGTVAFSSRIGLRIHGGSTRRMDQKSIRVYFRNAYGMDTLEYQLFPDKPISTYRRFILRSVRAYSPNDEFYQSLADGLDIEYQDARPAVVFINGEYWGLHVIRDRIDEHHLALHHGIQPSDINLLDGTTNMSISHGSFSNYITLMQYIAPSFNRLNANTGLPTPTTLKNDGAYAFVREYIDINNFIRYQLVQIYSANYDWPGKNIDMWNADAIGIPWRWILFDVELVSNPDRDMLTYAATDAGPTPPPSYAPNSPRATFLLRSLLENAAFKNDFISMAADLLNTNFNPIFAQMKLNTLYQKLDSEIAEHSQRWSRPGTGGWNSNRNALRNFTLQRPAHMRQHFIDYFDLDGLAEVSIDVNNRNWGTVQINSILIDENTIGLSDAAQPYPWSGIYFQGVPVTLTAIANPGYLFSHWEGFEGKSANVKENTASNQVTFELSDDVTITAVFEAESTTTLLHYWHFNSLPSGALVTVPSDYSFIGDAQITYPGSGSGYMDRVNDGTLINAQLDTVEGYGLRVRNPADTRELLLAMPSTGYNNLILRYAVTRTNNGAQYQSIHYRTSPDGNWLLFGDAIEVTADYQLETVDFSTITEINNNPDFAVRILFTGADAGNSSGNNRFDNITLEGTPVGDIVLPPQIINPIPTQYLIEQGLQADIDLRNIFQASATELQYSTVTTNPSVLTAEINNTLLSLIPLQRGDATVVVTVSDGINPSVETSFHVLVNPAAHRVQEGDFQFTAWSQELPEFTYPEHMLFLQSDRSDPVLDSPLEYAYFIPHDDYHNDDSDSIGFPYKATRRTRLNGLDDAGISFINTGRDRDLGGALLALDTTGIDHPVSIAWLGGTELTNTRAYELRLQYRIGNSGAFNDVILNGLPVLYPVGEDGHSETLGPVYLPQDAYHQPYIQLLWRYHHVGGDSGARAELRLDDIYIRLKTESLPPQVVRDLPVQSLIEQGTPISIDLNTVFSFSAESELEYTVTVDRPFILSAEISDDMLTITPHLRGDTEVTLEVSDGLYPAAVTTFRVLVYPQAYPLSADAFQFDYWSPESPEFSCPEHMMFLQSNQADPTLHTPLEYAYYIPVEEYHDDDAASIGFPYNNTRRTRLNGLGTDGISFINTGRDRDLGGALLALDTTALQGLAQISWVGGTLQTNSRSYEIRVQYRVGHTGPFFDLTDENGLPQAYMVNLDGHTKTFDPVPFPEAILGQPYVQLLWRYRHVGGDSGARAALRLDDIEIAIELGDPPPAPEITGDAFTNNTQPVWSWTSNSGIETYRFGWEVDNWFEELSGSTGYSPDSPLADGDYTLYVQELHSTGRWSAVGSHTIVVDTVAPTVAIASIATDQLHDNPIPVEILFSEEVVGFGIENIAVTNAELYNLSGEGGTFSVDVYPLATGEVTLQIPAGVCEDLAGNPNLASDPFNYDYIEKEVPVRYLALLFLFPLAGVFYLRRKQFLS